MGQSEQQMEGFRPRKNLYKWLYETEYQRNFGLPKNVMNCAPPQETFNNVISKSDKDTSKTTKTPKIWNGKTKMYSTVGIQVSENAPRPRSILKSQEIQGRPKTAPVLHTKMRHKSDEVQMDRKSSKIDSDRQLKKRNDAHYYSSILNPVAGKDSSTYERAPYIQSKKKITHVGDNVRLRSSYMSPDDVSANVLRNEPAIAKKRISCYSKNHNILRTHTIDENEDIHRDNCEEESEPIAEETVEAFDDDQYNIMKSLRNYQNYKSKSLPNSYRTSYNDDFTGIKRFVDSPIVSAERKINSKGKIFNFSPHAMSDVRYTKGCDSLYRKEYDKIKYETEYEKSHINDRDKLSTKHSEDNFFDYYNQVLRSREVAYKPILRNFCECEFQKEKTKKSSQDRNGKRKILLKESGGRGVTDDSVQLRVYDPEQYSDR